MAQIRDARLDIYYPGSSSPDIQVPRQDIRNFTLSRGYNDSKGASDITINGGTEVNPQYLSGGPGAGVRNIDIGNKVEIRALTEFSDPSKTLDDDGEALLDTVFVADVDPVLNPDKTIDINLSGGNFVFEVMRRRTAEGVFRNRRVVGNSESIINILLANNAEEIDRSQIQGLSSSASQQTATIVYNRGNLFEAVREAAFRVGGALNADQSALTIDFKSDLSPDLPLNNSDYHLPLDFGKTSETLLNFIVATGVDGTQVTEEFTTAPNTETQTTVDTEGQYHTSNDPITISQGNIPRVELKLLATDSQTDLLVAVQEDSGTPGDRGDDLGAAIIPNEDISSNFIRFVSAPVGVDSLNTDSIKIVFEARNPNTGIEVFGDDNDNDGDTDNFFYKLYKTFPSASIARNTTSIGNYRRHEARIRPEVDSQEAGTQVATAKLERNSSPERTLQFDAASLTTHTATTGRIYRVNNDVLNVQGDYIVTNINQQYRANNLTTKLTLLDVKSI